MTARHRAIVKALKAGARLWRYSTQASGWLYPPGRSSAPYQRVNGKTIQAMEDAGLIEEDAEQSYYRPDSGSDLVYRLTQSA